jgi:hypothetical protein
MRVAMPVTLQSTSHSSYCHSGVPLCRQLRLVRQLRLLGLLGLVRQLGQLGLLGLLGLLRQLRQLRLLRQFRLLLVSQNPKQHHDIVSSNKHGKNN